MKTSWPRKKLGEIVDILDNLRKPVTRRDRESGSYPYYGATGIQDYVADFIFDEKLVLVGEDGARWGAGDNSAYKISGKSWVNNHAHVLRSHKDILLDDWLVYYLNSTDLSEFITGTTVKKLNQEKLRSIEIPLPPMGEQKRIVEKLEKLLAKIKEAKKLRIEALEATQNILPSTLHQILSEGKEEGWEEKELANLMHAITPPAKIQKKDYGSVGKYPIIDQSQNDVSGWTDDRESLVEINEPVVVFGDHTCVVKYLDKPFVQGADGIKILKTNLDLLPKYLYIILKYQPLKSEGYRRHFSNLKKLKIPLPPLAEQKKIVAKLDALSEKVKNLQDLQQQTLDDLNALSASILHRAFNGEL